MTEEIVNINVQYTVQGLDRSVRDTQRWLYFLNASRLAIVDMQQVLSGATVSNVMWTAVQLTRVWTHLYRLVKATNQAQRVGVAQTLGGAALRGGGGSAAAAVARTSRIVFNPAIGWTMVAGGSPTVAQMGLYSTLIAMAGAHPILAGVAITGLAVSTLGYRQYFIDRKTKLEREKFIQKQRNIAKMQGLEY